MKFCLVFLATSALVLGAPHANSGSKSSNGIQEDFHDFLELIPMEKIRKIAVKHLHSDPDFQAAIKYIQSPEWIQIVTEFHDEPAVQEILEFLRNSGLDVNDYYKDVHKFIMDAKIPDSDHKTRSLSKFIQDVQDIMPIGALIDMFYNKMNNSPYFQEFFEKVTSDHAHMLVSKVKALPSFQKLADEMQDMGIDVNRVLRVIYSLFGWNENKYNFEKR